MSVWNIKGIGQSVLFWVPRWLQCLLVRLQGSLSPFVPVRCKFIVTGSGRESLIRSAATLDSRGSNQTRKHLYISIPSRARAILLIGLAALTLFVVGPLAGSLDDDGDGCPDTPVVVSDSVFFADQSADTGVDQHSGNIHCGVRTGPIRIPTPGARIIESPFLSVGACSVSHPCCSLRC